MRRPVHRPLHRPHSTSLLYIGQEFLTCIPMYAFVLFWNICFGKSTFVQVFINKWGLIPPKIFYDLLLITIQMILRYLEHHTLNIVFSIFIAVCDRCPIVFTFLQAVRTILWSKFGFGHRRNSFVVKVLVLWLKVWVLEWEFRFAKRMQVFVELAWEKCFVFRV